jgi:hypothetical protein
MSVFTAFEIEVLKLMAPSLVPISLLENLAREASLVRYEYTGSGYFLAVAHPQLPQEKVTLDEPIVMGHADGIDCGFVLFFGDRGLMIECHTWGAVDVPEDFRTKDVRVEVRTDVLR